jgi:TonB family protein
MDYQNSTIDSLIVEALLSLDREKAKSAWYEFQEIIRDDLPYTFLYAPQKITLVKKNIQGIQPDDKRPVVSFVDELWFRQIPSSAVELASLGESYKRSQTAAERRATRTVREEAPRAEEILQATAAPSVPERAATTTTSAGRRPVSGETETVAAEEEETGELPKFVPHEVPPKPLNLDKVPFAYPEVAKTLGLSGTVYLQLWIDKQGNVTNVILVKSVHPILDKVAVENARKLKFSPALQGNQPVAVPLSFPVRFQQ